MKKIIGAIILLCACSSSALSEELIVAAAANVQFVLEELKASFEKSHPGIEIKTVIGSSGRLTVQIENGAPFDIFLSADMDYPQTLYKEGLAVNEPKVYVYGTLVLWTIRDLNLSKWTEMIADPSIKKIAIASPKTAPYGRQTVNALKHYNLYMKVNKKFVYGESIAQTNQFISTGASDMGFTAKSVVLAENMKDKGKWIELDRDSYQPIAQGAVILKYAKDHDHLTAAQKFYEFIFSKEANNIYEKYGYILP